MFTGKTLVDGEWIIRKDCISRSETLGAISQSSFSKKVTLVVHGELAGNVKDAERGLSQKLLKVMQSRTAGRHIHVVDAAGYSDLLFGAPARCRDLKMQGDQVAVMPEVGDGYLGGPFERLHLRTRRVSQREASIFGRGTQGHAVILSRLAEQIVGRPSIEVREPSRLGPQFDLGWVSGRTTAYGAWVVGLELQGEEAPYRLKEAITYVHRSIRTVRSQTLFQPVVVLRNPMNLLPELQQAATSAHVVISWIPDLPGCI